MSELSQQSNVFLTGFTGSGKSTIGVLLAGELQFQFQDIDFCIEQDVNLSVHRILVDHGESYFRSREKQVLKNFHHSSRTVISLGGGTLLDEENIRMVKSAGFLVYLRCEPDAIWIRIKGTQKEALIHQPAEFGKINLNQEEAYMRIETILKVREANYLSAEFCGGYR